MLSLIAQAGAQADSESVVTYTAEQVLAPYVWVFGAAFLAAFIATPIMRRLAMANGIVDWPDLKRKSHLEPVAYLGGVALFLGWLAGVVLCFFIEPHTSHGALGGISSSMSFPFSILAGAAIICLVGLMDDVYGISPRVKVGGQLLAAALLASQTVGTDLAAGIIETAGTLLGADKPLPWVGIEPHWIDPAYWLGTVFVAVLVLGGCNATNLMDGLDGLASGVTGVVALGLTFICVGLAMGVYDPHGAYSPLQDPVRIVLCLALLGTVLGFLPYNFNPANVFMGDAGSLLLGYLSVTIILMLAEKGDPQLVMAGLIVYALPMLDTSLAIVRRKMRGRPLFSPDNQHIHHQLIRSGLSVKQSVLVLYLVALGFAALGGSMIFLRGRFVTMIFMVIFGFIVVTAYKVGHRQHLRQMATDADVPDAGPESIQSPAPEANDTAGPDAAADAEHRDRTSLTQPS